MSGAVSTLDAARVPVTPPDPTAIALRGQLEGLRAIIVSLPAATYRAAPSRVSGSVGAHVRHCLDHVRALVAQRKAADLSYDARLRGTPVETDPFAAATEIDRLCLELEEIDAHRSAEPVRLSLIAERQAGAVPVQTSLGRELAFVVQHTIHHAALIAVLLDILGVRVPAEFGYAPSTPR